MIFGAILAGGTGGRMKCSTSPKQFILLNKTPIIILTIKKMLLVDDFDYIYIGIHPEWEAFLKNMLNDYDIDTDKIRITQGGSTRLDTIYNLIACITKKHQENKSDIIVIHDAVRPFVTTRILEESIDGAKKYGAVVTAAPVVDTMLRSNDTFTVCDMPERANLYHGQSPDSFNVSMLIKALQTLTESDKQKITGTSQICMLAGMPIHMINGDRTNIKITTESDILIAKALSEMEFFL